MRKSIEAGLVYALVVFAAGFVFGAVRTLLVAPRIGATAAVLLEAPLILTVSWIVSRRCVQRFSVAADAVSRIVMGGVALATLLACEFGMAVLLFHRSASEIAASYAMPDGATGLVAQFVFATFPYIQLVRDRKSSSSRQQD